MAEPFQVLIDHFVIEGPGSEGGRCEEGAGREEVRERGWIGIF